MLADARFDGTAKCHHNFNPKNPMFLYFLNFHQKENPIHERDFPLMHKINRKKKQKL